MSEAGCWAVIPAAGVGRRMGGDVPKQYLPLAGRRVMDYAIEAFLGHPAISGVCVALAPDDAWWEGTDYANHPQLVRAPGGRERADSVLNALRVLSREAAGGDWVLVHDAARPCVRRADIDRLMAAVSAADTGGLLGIPVHDTVKRAGRDQRVRETVEREGLWRAFTPQMFRLGQLMDALSRALEAGATVTDEASAIEWAGGRPLMVEGAADNLKVTRPGDLEIALFYLRQREQES